MPDPFSGGPFVGQDFLPPAALMRTLAAFSRLSASWAPSQAIRLLGRGQTSQIRPTDVAVQAPLDELRNVLAPAALAWAKACGFWFARPPRLQLFPVRMIGDPENPAYQEAHVDSIASQAAPPLCTNVYYARAQGISGGDLILAPDNRSDLSDPIVIHPTVNTIVSFAGDRVHGVRPLYAGERLSVVINFY